VLVVIVTRTGWQFSRPPPPGLNTGWATWGIKYAADDMTPELIHPPLTAITFRKMPCALEVTDTVPLDASMSVPLVSLGTVPSKVYRMFAPAVAVVTVTDVAGVLGKVPPFGLMTGSATTGV
jgi:hypothetical protein